MRTSAFLLAFLLIVGCIPQPAIDVTPPPSPSPLTSTDDASEFIDTYRQGLAKAASDVAASARSGAYADMVALNADWTERSKQARVEAQNGLIQKMNATKDLEVSNPKVAEMFERLAAGWKKGGVK